MKPSTEGRRPAASAEWYRRAVRALPGGVSHPMRFAGGEPIYVDRALGSRVFDVEGREYVDYNMGSASQLLGHSHPDVVAAIRKQATLQTHTGNCHSLEVEWAELICAMVPSAERVRFTGSGTEAGMLAVRLARAATGRRAIVHVHGHYHGWSDAALPGSAPPYDEEPGEGLVEGAARATLAAPPDLDRIAGVVDQHGDVAAILVEPSGANWGSVPLPEGLVAGLRALADRVGCVLIFDEVITGFRWSPGGAQGRLGIAPDLTFLGKIVTGGMPGGAVAGREEIMCLLDPGASSRRRVVHMGTFNGCPIVAAAAIATLRHARTGAPQEHADRIAERLRDGYREILQRLDVPGAVYGESSTFHVYFGETPARDSVAGIPAQQIRGLPAELVHAYQSGLRAHGVDFLSYTGGVTSSAHTAADVDIALDAFEAMIRGLLTAGLLPVAAPGGRRSVHGS